MAKVIRWRREIVGGNAGVSATYQMKMVFRAFDRIAAYKDITPIQVTSGPVDVHIVNTNRQIGNNVLMWTNGAYIYIPSAVNWGNNTVAMAGALTHELGHRYWINSPTAHNTVDGGLMRAALYDAGQNFTVGDFARWYNLPNNGAARPWTEPNRWRSITADAHKLDVVVNQFGKPIYEFGCNLTRYQKLLHLFDRHSIAKIDDE